MSLPLQVIEATFKQSSSYLTARTSLDFPMANPSLPLSIHQQEALDLAISNSPIALITGDPGSGKTRISQVILNMAIRYQKSALLVAPHSSTLDAYENLEIRPFRLDEDHNYQDSITSWVKEKIDHPKLDFLPSYLLKDSLFEELANRKDCLTLANLDESTLTEKIKAIFPKVSQPRLDLLIYRFKQSISLLKQREYLRQQYQNLSEQAILQLADATRETAKIPIITTLNKVLETEIQVKKFDLIIIEDCHLIDRQELELFAKMTDKLILLGETSQENSAFSRLFQRLSSAYRVHLPDNFRLNYQLARLIFPYFYDSYPYSPLQKYTQFDHRLCWFDIRDPEKLFEQLLKVLSKINPDFTIGILTFSDEQKQILKNQLISVGKNQVLLDSLDNWHGKECDVILIVCEGTKPTRDQLRLALTRSREMIGCFGNITDYEKSAFSPLFKNELFHIEREVIL